MLRRASALLAGLLISVAPARAAPATDADKLATTRVQDLHYGDVLFHYFTGDDFEALTRLEAYQHWQRMPTHVSDAALLAGGMYLTLGLHNEAGARFEQLLTVTVPAGVRNRAWFHLARIWYTRGYFDRTTQALGRIDGSLGAELDAERTHLLVNALMQQQRFAEAAALLANWQGSPVWLAYARFNLGVALVRQDQLAQADPILTAVGTMNAAGTEMLALKDKANLALGYAWLQAGKPEPARSALNRVRLTGPYATRALLGVGWADSSLGEYRAALTPWLELHDRNLLDAAVQESYLAVPYAFAQLGAGAQAAEYYESAIRAFDEESGRLGTAIERIGEGHMLADLLGEGTGTSPGWFWQLKALPDSPQSRYLYAVLADNTFQESLKNFRDLHYFDNTLQTWSGNIDAFGAMVETRERAHAERLPRADALLADDRPAAMVGARTAVDTRLDNIEAGKDVAALGDATQRAQWARIRALEEALAQAGETADARAARDKLRLIRGTLSWQLDDAFRARVYEQRSAIRDLDGALNEAQNRWVRVQSARRSVPQNTAEYATRIAALNERLMALRGQLQQAALREEQFLTQLAQQELQAQQQRLAAYQVQARFALADIYDRASNAPAVTPVAAP